MLCLQVVSDYLTPYDGELLMMRAQSSPGDGVHLPHALLAGRAAGAQARLMRRGAPPVSAAPPPDCTALPLPRSRRCACLGVPLPGDWAPGPSLYMMHPTAVMEIEPREPGVSLPWQSTGRNRERTSAGLKDV